MRVFATAFMALTFATAAAPAFADVQQLAAAPGVPVPLTVETVLREDCSVGAAPQTRIVTPPVHGELSLQEGSLARKDGACPPAAGYVVLYLADADFNGPDLVTLEVTGADKTTTLHFEIQVRGKTTVPTEDVT
jgi:hypothetical protein